MDIKELNLTDEQMALVSKYVQSETDKVRTDYSAKLKTANDEIARLKPVEKSDAEKALEERISALESKEKELPEGLAQFLNVGEDMDKTIEEVGALFGNYFLNGSNKPSNHQTSKGITREDFKKMGYAERAKLYAENPSLYQALNK